MEQSTDDNFDWTRQSGGTSSEETGPSSAHNDYSGQGYYMYIEVADKQHGGYAM